MEIAGRRGREPDPWPAHWLFLNRDSAVGTSGNGLAKSIVELGTGIFVQDVQKTVVANLEHLRGNTHADRVRCAQIKVDVNFHDPSFSSIVVEHAQHPKAE